MGSELCIRDRYVRAETTDSDLLSMILSLRDKTLDLEIKLGGSKVRKEIGEEYEYPTMWTYLWSASGGTNSTYGPTASHKKSFENANQIFSTINSEFKNLHNQYEEVAPKLESIGAPKIKD